MGRTALLRTLACETLLKHLEEASEDVYVTTIDHAEQMLEEIELEVTYPSEFVIWRLIGERQDELDEEILGRDLRRELAILIQRASDRYPLDGNEAPGGVMDLHEAAASVGVSVRTLQRWRDEGLVLRHIHFPDGHVRIGVLNRSLERFRDRAPDRMRRASGFTRMSEDEEAQLLSKAQALMASGASPNQAALHVSAHSVRSHETIRQLLRRQRGEHGPVQGIGGRVVDRERTLVLRAADRGIGMTEVAERIGRSPASARRILAEARADRLCKLRPAWMDLPAFEQADAERVLLEAREIVERSTPAPPFDATPHALLDLIRTPDRHLEALLLPAMHLERRLAARRIDQLPRTPPVGRLDEIETGLRRADVLRRRAGEAVLGAALGRVEQQLGSSLSAFTVPELSRWIHFCVDVVDATLDSFDPRARGEIAPRLDRRIALETDKQIALLERSQGRVVQEVDVDALTADSFLARLESTRHALGLAPWLIPRISRLDTQKQEIVRSRFGLGSTRPLTIQELATEFGIPLRSMNSTLRKCRSALRGNTD